MRLRIRRLGGIAGVALQTQLDTADLPAEQATRVEGAVRELVGRAPVEPPHPDAFRYEITPLDEPGETSALINERDVPPELNGLVEAVNESGAIENRDRS